MNINKIPLKLRSAIAAAAALAFPFAAMAADTKLSDVIDKVIDYLNRALFVLMAVAVVMFVFYVIKYFVKADSDKKAAGLYVMYSVIGFFVIFSIWGIVNIISASFGIERRQGPTYQEINNLFPRNSGTTPGPGTGTGSNPPGPGTGTGSTPP